MEYLNNGCDEGKQEMTSGNIKLQRVGYGVALLTCMSALIPVSASEVTSTYSEEANTLPSQEPAGPGDPVRPNILFCLADDWGWPHAGVYGDTAVKTPTFDRLAKEGVLFQHAFVSSPSCTPSRNAVLTGRQFYTLDQGANLWGTLDIRHPNFMFLLREAGYEVGHWRKAWGPGDFTAGGYTEHPCGPEIDFISFMKGRDRTKPFCFWFGTGDPHRPYDKGSGAKGGIDLTQIHVPSFYPDKDEIRSDIADYYGEVQRWDGDVGKALELLEQQGELDNTIIVMTGDNGMPFPRCKANLYDGGARMPLAIRWGSTARPARTVSDFISFADFAPTFLEAAGLEPPQEMTGRSLLPVLKAEGEGRLDKNRDFVVFGRERHTPAQKNPSIEGYPARAIRTDKWLLIVNLESDRWPAGVAEGATHPMRSFTDCDNGPTKALIKQMRADPENERFYELCFGQRPAVELYDCEKDPEQVNNLADDPQHGDTIKELRSQLVAYLESTGDPRFTDQPVKFETYPYRRNN